MQRSYQNKKKLYKKHNYFIINLRQTDINQRRKSIFLIPYVFTCIVKTERSTQQVFSTPYSIFSRTFYYSRLSYPVALCLLLDDIAYIVYLTRGEERFTLGILSDKIRYFFFFFFFQRRLSIRQGQGHSQLKHQFLYSHHFSAASSQRFFMLKELLSNVIFMLIYIRKIQYLCNEIQVYASL